MKSKKPGFLLFYNRDTWKLIVITKYSKYITKYAIKPIYFLKNLFSMLIKIIKTDIYKKRKNQSCVKIIPKQVHFISLKIIQKLPVVYFSHFQDLLRGKKNN